MANKIATFGGGWFWTTDALFAAVKGVVDTTVGYTGGHTQNPTYQDVCSNKTGHIEVVQVTYDDSIVTYENLLDIFWKNHDPTSMDSQKGDTGIQYRSVIFYHDNEQKLLAEKAKETLDTSGVYQKPIVTVVTAAMPFYRAEEYHQNYYAKKQKWSVYSIAWNQWEIVHPGTWYVLGWTLINLNE